MTPTTQQLDHASIGTEAWRLRLSRDLQATEEFLPTALRHLHETVVARARQAQVHGLVLSGSTARGKRTEISDVDDHVVGRRIDMTDLSPKLDLHVLSREELEADVVAGHDFIHSGDASRGPTVTFGPAVPTLSPSRASSPPMCARIQPASSGP